MTETAKLEAIIGTRIGELKSRARALTHEIHTLGGKIANRAPAQAQAVSKKNEALRARVLSLEVALAEHLNQSLIPSQAEDFSIQAETLRKATVEHCQQNNIDPELWKNLAY